MKMSLKHWCVGLASLAAMSTSAMAQVENADFRIRADLRIPNDAPWGAGESVCNADFRIHSRFMQLYYGGVHRNDEFRFTISLDFTGSSDFASGFATSAFNNDLDVYINDAFVGRIDMNASTFGIGELEYDSRHAELPTLPLPANFPDPVNVGDIVRVYGAAADLPAIGSARPAGTALLQKALTEKFDRGDANQDGHVDEDDFTFLAAAYDPGHTNGLHFGPANGDFTGDNLADLADYELFVQNWDGNGDAPAEPASTSGNCVADLDNGSGIGTTDGAVDINDLVYFLIAFEEGSVNADLDNGAGTGTTDSAVDISDLLYFIAHFEVGC